MQVYFPILVITAISRTFNVKISLKKLSTLSCFKIFHLSFSQKLFLREMLAFVSIKTVHKFHKKHNCTIAQFEQLNLKAFLAFLTK